MSIDPAIKQIKIHPAIGLARLSTNSDYYVFGDPAIIQEKYKSNNKMKRQAVQFRLFAYGENNNGLYELTAEKLSEMGLKAVWEVSLANRKISKQRGDQRYVISAKGDTSSGDVELVGKCGDFVEGQAIKLGEMTRAGVFIPPIAVIAKRRADTPVPAYGMHNQDIADNTSDGMVSAWLVPSGKDDAPDVPIVPAWVSTGPQNYAPEWNDEGERNLLIYLEELLNTPNRTPANPINKLAQEIDREVLKRGTATFAPGIELSGRIFQPDLFYPASQTGDPDEIRFKPQDGGSGVQPGGVTDGLCCPWQGDFHACTCAWWPNQRPDMVFKDDGAGASATWLRRIADQDGANPPGGKLDTNQAFIDHVDELGVVKKNEAYPGKRAETERQDNIGGMV